ncbi:MAG TPA: protease pro-enzyme activation domain-containing protein, partial [Acidobacteriaceae bacterium]
MTIRVALQVQNKAALLSFVTAVADPANPAYGKFLTPQQFTAQYAPTTAQVQQVVSYLKGAGLSNITVEPNNLMITA